MNAWIIAPAPTIFLGSVYDSFFRNLMLQYSVFCLEQRYLHDLLSSAPKLLLRKREKHILFFKWNSYLFPTARGITTRTSCECEKAHAQGFKLLRKKHLVFLSYLWKAQFTIRCGKVNDKRWISEAFLKHFSNTFESIVNS